MDVSKLALPLLIPDLGQLGHVHLHRFISQTGRTAKIEGETMQSLKKMRTSPLQHSITN